MSRRKDRWSWALIGLLLLGVGLAAYYVLWPQLQPHVIVRLGDGVFSARVKSVEKPDNNVAAASSYQLQNDQAILHVYPTDKFWAIDATQRHHPVDVVWLDKDKKVIYIVKNASSDSKPKTLFTPNDAARYMIELPAATVQQKAIGIGDTAVFDESNIQGFRL